MKKVTVIGAGFAGLTVSLRLAQKGFQVELHEKSSRVGGLLGTDTTSLGIAERAANALIRTAKAEALFAELGLTPSTPLPSAKKRFLFRDQPRTWPLTWGETLGFIGRLLPRLLSGGKKRLQPRPQESLQTWGERLLGKAPTQFILGPAMQGIYGNEISGLSASVILGPLFAKKKKDKYKGLLTGPQGMQDLVNHLEEHCLKRGVRIHRNSSIQAESVVGPLIVATSAQAAAEFLKERDPSLANLLARIRMSSLMSVTLFFKAPQTTYQGFGCLIPRGLGLRSLGVLMNSYIFKDRDKTYNETWILGGHQEERLLDLSDAELLQLLAEERFRILGSRESLLDYRINRWKKALPYYDLELEKVVNELHQIQGRNGVYIHGNYLGGIGLSKILERSDLLAEELEKSYG